YDWRLPPQPAAKTKPWVVEAVDRMITWFRSLAQSVGQAIERAVRWLMKQWSGDLRERQPGAPPSGLPVGMYLVIAAGLAGVAMFARRALRRRSIAAPAVSGEAAAAVPLDASELSPDRLPEEEWIALAERSVREENFRLALRALYLANLAWLGRR